jgi:hypothetical protein
MPAAPLELFLSAEGVYEVDLSLRTRIRLFFIQRFEAYLEGTLAKFEKRLNKYFELYKIRNQTMTTSTQNEERSPIVYRRKFDSYSGETRGCFTIAYEVNGDEVTYSAAARAPQDTYVKKTGENKALGRFASPNWRRTIIVENASELTAGHIQIEIDFDIQEGNYPFTTFAQNTEILTPLWFFGPVDEQNSNYWLSY